MGNGLTSECSDRYSLTKEMSSVTIVGFFIPVSSLKVFGHSIHFERKRIYLGKSIQTLQNDTSLVQTIAGKKIGKSILEVPDTGTRVLNNTKPFLSSSIVIF